MADRPASPLMRAEDLRATLQELTSLLAEMRREQLAMEAYALVTRLALGTLLREAPPAARAAVAARLRSGPGALLGPGVAPDSPLARAVAEEAERLAGALDPAGG